MIATANMCTITIHNMLFTFHIIGGFLYYEKYSFKKVHFKNMKKIFQNLKFSLKKFSVQWTDSSWLQDAMLLRAKIIVK